MSMSQRDREKAPLLKAIVETTYLTYEQKRKILQDVMARAQRKGDRVADEDNGEDFGLAHALDMLEATVVTNQDMPEQAPQKSGYSPKSTA